MFTDRHESCFALIPEKSGIFFVLFGISKNILYLYFMSNELIIVLVFFWATSAAYTMYTHKKNYTLSLEIIFGAILLGPILAIFVKDDHEHRIKKYHEIEENERESNERHRRWFQTLGLINRQHIPNYGRTIPPPPPISRIERARTERDEAIRTAIERIDKNKLKDFKFFRSNVKDTER